MKRKYFLFAGFVSVLILTFITRILGINQNIITLILLLTAFIGLPLGIINLTNRYLTNYNFKIIKEYFNLLVNIHKDKYKSYFEYNQDKTKAFCELFTRNCDEFIEILEDKKRNEILEFSPKQSQLLKKMLLKAKEMKENTFVADYSI